MRAQEHRKEHRVKAFFVRVWRAINRWFIDPAAMPEQIGTDAGRKHHRPIPIELGFYLHADGNVYFRNRRDHTQVRVTENWRRKNASKLFDPERHSQGGMTTTEFIEALVHHEYAVLASMAREDLARKTARRKAQAAREAERTKKTKGRVVSKETRPGTFLDEPDIDTPE